MSSESTNLDSPGLPRSISYETRKQSMRLPVVALVACAFVSAGCGVAAITLPWFALPQPTSGLPWSSFISTSNALSVDPFGSSDLAPGTQSWGYLLVVWSAVVVGLAVVAISACVRSTRRKLPAPARLLLCVVAAALVLVALGISEITAKIPFGDGPPLTYDFGAVLGVVLAVLSLISAFVAWATTRYPWLVHDPAIDSDWL
jgi:hypothetical protein